MLPIDKQLDYIANRIQVHVPHGLDQASVPDGGNTDYANGTGYDDICRRIIGYRDDAIADDDARSADRWQRCLRSVQIWHGTDSSLDLPRPAVLGMPIE